MIIVCMLHHNTVFLFSSKVIRALQAINSRLDELAFAQEQPPVVSNSKPEPEDSLQFKAKWCQQK
jgi:hypothetical protein